MYLVYSVSSGSPRTRTERSASSSVPGRVITLASARSSPTRCARGRELQRDVALIRCGGRSTGCTGRWARWACCCLRQLRFQPISLRSRAAGAAQFSSGCNVRAQGGQQGADYPYGSAVPHLQREARHDVAPVPRQVARDLQGQGQPSFVARDQSG